MSNGSRRLDVNTSQRLSDPSTEVSTMEECSACCEEFTLYKILHVQGDPACHGCIRTLFRHAVEDESNYPPQWAGHELAIDDYAHILSDGLISQYQQKIPEYLLKWDDRVYCLRPRLAKDGAPCGTFLGEQKQPGGVSEIKKCSCKVYVCMICKEHTVPRNHKCQTLEEQDADFKGLKKGKDWQSCPSCKNKIQLRDGCNHVVCLCGEELCFICGAPAEANSNHWSRTRSKGACPRYNQPDTAGAIFDPADDHDGVEDFGAFFGRHIRAITANLWALEDANLHPEETEQTLPGNGPHLPLMLWDGILRGARGAETNNMPIEQADPLPNNDEDAPPVGEAADELLLPRHAAAPRDTATAMQTDLERVHTQLQRIDAVLDQLQFERQLTNRQDLQQERPRMRLTIGDEVFPELHQEGEAAGEIGRTTSPGGTNLVNNDPAPSTVTNSTTGFVHARLLWHNMPPGMVGPDQRVPHEEELGHATLTFTPAPNASSEEPPRSPPPTVHARPFANPSVGTQLGPAQGQRATLPLRPSPFAANPLHGTPVQPLRTRAQPGYPLDFPDDLPPQLATTQGAVQSLNRPGSRQRATRARSAVRDRAQSLNFGFTFGNNSQTRSRTAREEDPVRSHVRRNAVDHTHDREG